MTTSSSNRPHLRGAALVITLLLSVAMVFLAGRQIMLNIRFSGLLHLSAQLDREDRISPQALTHYMPDTAAIVADGICREDIVQAGKKLVMRDLDSRNPLIDVEWDSTVAAGERYIRHSLSCLPANGDLWLRLAMLREVTAAPYEEVAVLMQQSQMLTPAEESIIAARMTMWIRLPEKTIAIVEGALRSDLDTLCSWRPDSVPERFRSLCSSGRRG